MKKLLALLLCLVMVVSVFAGCNNNTDNNDGTNAGTTGNKVDQTLPEDIELTIGIPDTGIVEDFDTNALTLWLEEQTGYDLKFVKYLPSPADYKAKLSTAMVNGDELPDILVGFNLGKAYYQDLGEDGYLVNLNQFFNDEEKSKTWWDRFETLDEEYQELILNTLYADNEEDIWCFPVIEQSDYDVQKFQFSINQEWLKTLNLEMPNSPETLYEVLKAFKTRDPNGNGKADEIPLLAAVGSMYADPVQWITNMFIYDDYNRTWRVDENGELYHIYESEEYREALKFIRKLVDEQLMSTTCWGLDGSVIKSLMAPVDGVATIGIAGMHNAGWPIDTALLYQYTAMEYWGYGVLNTQRNEWMTFITEDCEYPEAAWNIFMLMSTEEGGYRSRYGEKGTDWDDADPGAESFLGREAKLQWYNIDSAATSTWGTNYFGILTDSENERTQLEDDLTEWHKYRYDLMRQQYENYYEAVERKPDNVVPALKYTVEESEEITVDQQNVRNVINTARASFCTGQSSNGKYTDPSNDAQWEQYKKEIQAQGYENWKEMAQVIYDDQYGG